MDFRIADTFTASLARLSGEEQKAVKTTAFDLQLNPTNPGMQLHKLAKAKDPNFWSVRVNSDVRLIVHTGPNCRMSTASLKSEAERSRSSMASHQRSRSRRPSRMNENT